MLEPDMDRILGKKRPRAVGLGLDAEIDRHLNTEPITEAHARSGVKHTTGEAYLRDIAITLRLLLRLRVHRG